MRVQARREMIDVTLGGSWCTKPDPYRKFLPGPITYELVDDDGDVVEITAEEYEEYGVMLA